MKKERLPLFRGGLSVCEEEGLLGGTLFHWMVAGLLPMNPGCGVGDIRDRLKERKDRKVG